MDTSWRPNTKAEYTALSVLGFLLLLVCLWAFTDEHPESSGAFFTPIAKVEVQPFEIYITESAELEASQSVILSSDLPSNTGKLLYLAPEGLLINEGEEIARFDPTPFEEEIQKIENNIKEEQANIQQAEAELGLQESDGEDRLSKIDHQIEMAKLKLTNFEKSTMPLRLANAEKEVERASAERRKASQSANTQRNLIEQGLTTKKALQQAVDVENEKKSVERIAQQNLKSLKEISLPSELKQSQLQYQNRINERDIYAKTLGQKIQKQASAIQRINHKIDVLKQNLEHAQRNLEHTSIRAPVSGTLLYKNMSFQKETRKAQIGDSLWNHQGFAVIPDMSSMIALTRIRENEIGTIEVGQEATLRPEAYSNTLLSGQVDAIGSLAADTTTESSTRYFEVRIALKEPDQRLRPGMTASVSILTRRYDQALLVPVEAVFFEEQSSYCFLWRNGRPKRIEVELGETNGQKVIVKTGLEEGQEVMLSYPKTYES